MTLLKNFMHFNYKSYKLAYLFYKFSQVYCKASHLGIALVAFSFQLYVLLAMELCWAEVGKLVTNIQYVTVDLLLGVTKSVAIEKNILNFTK